MNNPQKDYKRLVLRCDLPPGDVLMLTAAVRDLHRHYPGRFKTDVRTPYPEMWEHNPFITALKERDPGVETVQCHYPLVHRCNHSPYHFLHGFVEFLNERLQVRFRPTDFKGDIYLSDAEKAAPCPLTDVLSPGGGEGVPYWLIVAGGKTDFTIKWWETARWQRVVDFFQGRIQFVQTGAVEHHHPPLNGVIDMRGKTTTRELFRLVYHAQGVLCPVTFAMHLAAAVPLRKVESRKGKWEMNSARRLISGLRPCVVVAGGREPPHWEAYPGHQFIHTIGQLPCCRHGGCWKSRTVPLGDGDPNDQSLCENVVNDLPRCMHMVTPAEVIRRIEGYFTGGMCEYLKPRRDSKGHEFHAAMVQPVGEATHSPAFDAPLTNETAHWRMNEFIASLVDRAATPALRPTPQARGIVICGGGPRYFTCAWVCINSLRRLGCALPIQLWHLGDKEMDAEMRALVAPLGVECVDGLEIRKMHPARRLGGWELKPYAMLHAPFKEVLFLDADNVPVVQILAPPELKGRVVARLEEDGFAGGAWKRMQTATSLYRSVFLLPRPFRPVKAGHYFGSLFSLST